MAELYIPTERPKRNPTNGRFLPGHTPANKGKKWSEYMPKKSQRRAAKGWKNLEKGHAFGHPAVQNAGRCRKAVVGVNDDGSFKVFGYLLSAARFYGGNRENIGRCCRLNSSEKELYKPWSKKNGAKADKGINTDHKYMGIRFYFESDIHIWKHKINKQNI